MNECPAGNEHLWMDEFVIPFCLYCGAHKYNALVLSEDDDD